MHHSVILHQAEGGELAPTIVESRVCGIVFAFCREQVFDSLLGDTAGFEGGVAFGWERVGVECYKRVFRAMFLDGIIER